MKKNSKPQPCIPTTKRPTRVTLADIRRINGYGHLSDGEAGRILASIRQFVSLLAHHIQSSHAHE